MGYSGGATEPMSCRAQRKGLCSPQGIYQVASLSLWGLSLAVTNGCVVYWQVIIFHTEPPFDKTMTGTTVNTAASLMYVFFFMESGTIVRVLKVVNPIEEMSDKFVYQRSLL